MLEDIEIPQGDEEADAQKYPLLTYALAYWPLHVLSSSNRIQNYEKTDLDYWFPSNTLGEDLVVYAIVYLGLNNLLQSMRHGGNGSEITDSAAGGNGMILDLNTTVDARNSLGHTALPITSSLGPLEMVHVLLRRGADPNATNCNGLKSVHFAAQGDDIDVLNTLSVLTEDIESQALEGETPLLLATDPGIINALLDAGANIN
ncbi:uncharacterized protein A1O5_10948 [Cladophialophora psammophila CBS 110553]|uniref:protein S-acyltransferase n=1 Tax=Cladophialophora psammophila CBS 110553 TaxID=1182543 RepID=W9WCX9_9EURO|nr:uncharacterized protein A1O5_10948 [Cladophialophora psammophila CBS 110553]EXJ65972.1 hypothetical protein A1O5_10948 [Cladophialophora psammophila CBS 110553]